MKMSRDIFTVIFVTFPLSFLFFFHIFIFLPSFLKLSGANMNTFQYIATLQLLFGNILRS